MTSPGEWGQAIGALGPLGLIVIPIVAVLIVVALFVGGTVVALTGIPRWRIPGLAWVTAGVWRELHGLRGDLRAWQRGDLLPDLEPIPDSAPPALGRRREPAAPPSARASSPSSAPRSKRR